MNEKEIKEDINYILNNVPYLYQYISISGALKFIDNLQLMVSKPQRFNDPYDCIYDLIQFKHIPKKYLQNGHKEDYVRELFSKKIFPDTLKNMGVSCFSETGDNMLMWSHYADCHQGICVAYNLNEF
jgi:hypothetical protein